MRGRIEFEGASMQDVEDAVREALRRILNGNTEGHDKRAWSKFSFQVEGEEAEARDAESKWFVHLKVRFKGGFKAEHDYVVRAKNYDHAVDRAEEQAPVNVNAEDVADYDFHVRREEGEE